MTTTLRLTDEQQACIDAARTGSALAITAVAGAGKTSTLRAIAGDDMAKRNLYVAFNKAIQEDAAKSFPSNTECRTAHSLAFRQFGVALRHRVFDARRADDATQIDQFDVDDLVVGVHRSGGEKRPVVVPARSLLRAGRAAERRFMRSADERIGPQHVWASDLPLPEGVDHAVFTDAVVDLARRMWAESTSPAGTSRIPQDVYAKLWQLSSPILRFDAIFYDEAQDADPLIADVLLAQPDRSGAQLIAVGDSAQAIYGWRGAADVLSAIPGATPLTLTQSFRFGPAIAQVANRWLDEIEADVRVVGSPDIDSTVGAGGRPDAVLCRSNGGAMAEVIGAQSRGRDVALVGGAKDIIAFGGAATDLRRGRRTSHPELAAFASWEEVQAFAASEDGKEMRTLVSLVDRIGPDELVSAARCLVSEPQADLVVSTAHKAKGREWPSVRIANDFYEPTDEKGRPAPVERAEAMLAYVAVTRAKRHLDPGGLSWIDHRPSPASEDDDSWDDDGWDDGWGDDEESC